MDSSSQSLSLQHRQMLADAEDAWERLGGKQYPTHEAYRNMFNVEEIHIIQWKQSAHDILVECGYNFKDTYAHQKSDLNFDHVVAAMKIRNPELTGQRWRDTTGQLPAGFEAKVDEQIKQFVLAEARNSRRKGNKSGSLSDSPSTGTKRVQLDEPPESPRPQRQRAAPPSQITHGSTGAKTTRDLSQPSHESIGLARTAAATQALQIASLPVNEGETISLWSATIRLVHMPLRETIWQVTLAEFRLQDREIVTADSFDIHSFWDHAATYVRSKTDLDPWKCQWFWLEWSPTREGLTVYCDPRCCLIPDDIFDQQRKPSYVEVPRLDGGALRNALHVMSAQGNITLYIVDESEDISRFTYELARPEIPYISPNRYHIIRHSKPSAPPANEDVMMIDRPTIEHPTVEDPTTQTPTIDPATSDIDPSSNPTIESSSAVNPTHDNDETQTGDANTGAAQSDTHISEQEEDAEDTFSDVEDNPEDEPNPTIREIDRSWQMTQELDKPDLSRKDEKDVNFCDMLMNEWYQERAPGAELDADQIDNQVNVEDDDLLGSFSKLQRPQLDPQRFRKACWFFGLDQTNLSASSASKRYGCTRTTPIYQLYCVWWVIERMMVQQGALIADDTGLGKTTEAVLFLVIKMVMQRLSHLCRRYPHKHLPEAKRRKTGEPYKLCPSHDHIRTKTGLICPCEFLFNGYGVPFWCPGVHVITPPASLITNWIEEINDTVDRPLLQLRILVARQMTQAEQGKYNVESIGDAGDNIVEKFFNSDATGAFHPRRANDTTIILTSHQSFDSRFGDRVKSLAKTVLPASTLIYDEQHTTASTKRMTPQSNAFGQSQPHCLFLTATPIETHVMNLEPALYQTRRCWPEDNIYDKTIRKLFDPIKLQKISKLFDRVVDDRRESKENTATEEDKANAVQHLKALCEAFTIRRSADTPWLDGKLTVIIPPHKHADVKLKSYPSMLTVLQRVLEDLEHASVERLNKRQAAYHKAGEKQKQKLFGGKLPEKLTNEASIGLAHKARIAAIVPYLLKLQHDGLWESKDTGITVVTAKDITASKSWISPHIDQLIDTSPHLQWLKDMWFGTAASPGLANLRDFLDRPEKLLIDCSFPVVCALICRMFNDLGVPCVNLNAVPTQKRQAEVQLFQDAYNNAGDAAGDDTGYDAGDDTENDTRDDTNDEASDDASDGSGNDEDNNKKRQPVRVKPLILVGTYEIIGQGFTLTRAMRIVHVAPDFLRRKEIQGTGRVSRVRMVQKNHCTYSYRLLLEGYPIEKKIVERQERRTEVIMSSMHDIQSLRSEFNETFRKEMEAFTATQKPRTGESIEEAMSHLSHGDRDSNDTTAMEGVIQGLAQNDNDTAAMEGVVQSSAQDEAP